MKNKKIIYILLIIVIILLIVAIFFKQNNKENLNITVDDTNTVEMRSFDWNSISEKDIISSKGVINITESGKYTLSGELSKVYIDTKGSVEIVLDGVSITSSDGPAIMIENAKLVRISLSEGSYNKVSDSSMYSDTGDEDDINACIFSRENLIISGTGTLEVNANYGDGIASKDNLLIESGTFIINSLDDGIRGKDSLVIDDGNFTIISSGDGLKSTNKEIGYIQINNGKFNITSELDGIQSETNIIINNGEFNIITGGGSANSSSNNENWGYWGPSRGNKNQSVDNGSAKGIKAALDLKILDGTFNIDSSDDSIHTNQNIEIDNGTFEIKSGDDGIHSDKMLTINNGNINIIKSYEGIESSIITINNGTIKLVSSDDGINVAGGNDSSSQGRPGANTYSNSSSNYLTINNGDIYVNSSGDGIDINGSGYINGGKIVVDGPSDNGNGALDYDEVFEIKAGSLVAGGSSGMAQSLSPSSTQANVIIYFNTTVSSSSKIQIKYENETLVEYSPVKNIQSLVLSLENFEQGKTYTIYINETKYSTFTISGINNTVGNSRNQQNNGMRR